MAPLHRHSNWHAALHSALLLVIATPATAWADCAEELQALSSDLRGVALTEAQKQRLGGIIDDARRYCWVHREEPAMDYIAQARAVAGLRPAGRESEWETVPLESLEKTPPVKR